MNKEVFFSIERREILPVTPTFFVCLGTSGAGLTTAIAEVTKTGLVKNPPTQFTTRPLRASERSGEQYYSVSDEVLAKIPRQIVLEASLYGNRYGFFRPAVEFIKKMLRTENVIIDSANSKKDWEQVLLDHNLISIFFAPQTPDISIHRLINRALQNGTPLTQQEIDARLKDSIESVKNIKAFDYWIDTTNFLTIVPDLISIINFHSFGHQVSPTAIEVKTNDELVSQLIFSYSKLF